MGNGLSLAVAVGVPLLGGQLGAVVSMRDLRGWYKKIKKPRWTPPNPVFGIVWPILYTCQGVASWLVFKQKGASRALPLSLYAGQLLLNLIWQPLFFHAHKLRLATFESAAMVGLATAATVTMSRAAGSGKILPLMIPYLTWITFATALSAKIWLDNPDADKLDSDGNPKDAVAAVAAAPVKSEGTKQA